MTGASGTATCIFCDAAEAGGNADAQAPLVVYRGTHAFVILNLFPYNNGHLMIVPRRHIAALREASAAELNELIELTRRAEAALTETYTPHGLNVGINLGKAAGAGVADHLHIHVVPRWNGDTNFMSVVGSTRVLPETLERTAERLRPVFEKLEKLAAP